MTFQPAVVAAQTGNMKQVKVQHLDQVHLSAQMVSMELVVEVEAATLAIPQ